MRLTKDQWDELDAILDVMKATGKPTFMHKSNLSFYDPLFDDGLIEIGPHPDFSRDFKAISLTQRGMFRLAKRKAKIAEKLANKVCAALGETYA